MSNHKIILSISKKKRKNIQNKKWQEVHSEPKEILEDVRGHFAAFFANMFENLNKLNTLLMKKRLTKVYGKCHLKCKVQTD